MRSRYRYANVVRIIAILLLLFAQRPTPVVIASPANAAPQDASTVVTDCTEAGFEAALAVGGSITFNCGGPATIAISTEKQITKDTAIDGSNNGNPVVLNAVAKVSILHMQGDYNLSLSHLTLQNGYAPDTTWYPTSYGGALVVRGGTITVDSVRFYKNGAAQGGAIDYDNATTGSLIVRNSTFEENTADGHWDYSWGHGGAISTNAPTAIIEASTFKGNVSKGNTGGAVFSTGASLSISGSTFESNTAYYEGGAVNFAPGTETSTLTVRDSHFKLNQSTGYLGGGMTVSCNGTNPVAATFEQTDFVENFANSGGGGLALFKNTVLYADHLTFDRNSSKAGGGAGLSSEGVTGKPGRLTNSLFTGNKTESGGGGAYIGGPMLVQNVRFENNQAAQGAGLLIGQSVTGADVQVMNSVFTGNLVIGETGNTGTDGGSAIYSSTWDQVEISGNTLTSNRVNQRTQYGEPVDGGVIALWNVGKFLITNNTIANNDGTGLANVVFTIGGAYTLSYNTIVNNTGDGTALYNHYGDGSPILEGNILINDSDASKVECHGNFTTRGYNLFDDSTCGLATGDVITDDPGLSGLSENGGPTKTFNLYENSQALNAGGGPNCPTVDQRGVSRPVDTACDIGAVEADAPLPLPPAPPPLPVLTNRSYSSSPLPMTEAAARNEMTFRGDPVNTIFGNFTYQHTDLRMPGIFPFNMDRAYNSAAPADGPLGFGWAAPFDQHVSQPAADQLVVKRADGRQDYYTISGEAIQAPAGSRDVLARRSEGGYTLTTRQFIMYRFNSAGRLVSATDPNGNSISFTYSGEQLTMIRDAGGRSWTLAYDAASGRLTSLKDPAGREINYAYDASGNLIEVTNPEGGVTHYAYDNQHHLTKITDPGGQLIAAMDYDLDGRVVFQSDARGTHKYVYTPGETRYTNPTGLVTAIKYDAQYRVTENITGADTPEAITTRISYGADGFIASQTDGQGNTTYYQHDLDGNITEIKDALNQVTEMTYDERGNLLTRTDALDHTTTYRYNDANQVLTVTDPSGAVTTNTYDPHGLLVESIDALGQKTQFSYDSFGNLLTVTDALDGQVTYDYDDAGRVTQRTDALGNLTIYTYNALDLVLTQKAPDGGITTYTYSPNGNLLTRQDPLGHLTAYTYTLANDLESVQDALGNRAVYTYDALGHRMSEQRPDGATWRNAYDAFGRLVSRTSPLGLKTAYTYDANGSILTATDPAGSTLSYTYDALNRMTGVKDAMNGQTRYSYDADGRLESITDPLNHTTSYAYDALGRRTSETDALNHTTTFKYDALGRLIEHQNAAGQKVTYNYDALGRLLSVSGAGVAASYTYDAAGRRASMTDSLGQTKYDYDAAGRLTSISGPQGSLAYTYDLAGNRKSMTQPGARVAYTYDALNRLDSLSLGDALLASYSYNASGLNDHQTLGNGVVTTRVYDADARLVSLQSSLGNDPLLSLAYTLNKRGDRTGETTQIQGAAAFSAVYGYDTSGRLVTASLQVPAQYKVYLPAIVRTSTGVPAAALPGSQATNLLTLEYTYTYDAAGNRLTAKENGSATALSYNAANQISSGGYLYDAAGRLTSDGAITYTYDALNRVTSISGKINASYIYDGDGNRVSETVGGVTTAYLLDPNLPLPLRIAATQGGKTTRSFFGLSLVAEERPDGTLQYLHTDGLGNIRLVTGADGKVLGHAAYAPFGTMVEGQLPAAFGFTGEPGSAGLIYLRARDYSPTLGRFLAPDMAPPDLTDPQTVNRYAYVRNSPVNLTDPSGLCWFGICEAFSGMVSGVQSAVQATVSMVQSAAQAVSGFFANPPAASPLTENNLNSCSLTNASGEGIVSRDGAGIVSRDGAGIVSRDGAGIVSRDGAGIVSRDGAGIVSRDGAGVITMGGGNLISTSGGNVIAFGGGNLISDKGLGLMNPTQAGVIAFGGGNVIAMGGGN